ncbi:MAG: DEAD/DEAH box helicase [bacterium]
MEVIQDTAVKLTLRNDIADRALQFIDKSEKLREFNGRKEIVVYWGHDEIESLASIMDNSPAATTDIPSPMIRDYDWPGFYTPFDHQRNTASFLSIRPRAFCFNEAGTGKTSAAIWAADYLMKLDKIKRVLVICPLSIMSSAWRDDIFKTAMHRTVAVAHGTANKRKIVIDGEYEFVIINYDGVNIVKEDLKRARFDLIIIDEANAYKTASTKRWKTLASIITPATRIWMMTGTPASQSPVDAFGLAKMISPHRIPKFMTAWRDKVMFPITRFKWKAKDTAKNDVYSALQPAIRYAKRDCLDLPEVTYQTRDIPMTVQAARYYKELKHELLIEAAGEQISAVNAASAMSKLLQISGGAVYTDQHDIVEFDITHRLKALKEVLDETLHKVLIFVPFLHTIEVITKFLNQEGLSNEVIKGDVSANERTRIISNFQMMEDPRILVIQPQSASHGVTLTAADTIIFWGPVLSVETYIQCIGRIDRVGQKNKCTVVHLQSSDAERRVYSMLQGKVDSHLKLVDLYRQELEEV